jgi:hypothetical protein
MSFNRRRHANAVSLTSVATWVSVCLFLGGAGLGYVSIKNQAHTKGATIKNLERTLADLKTQDEVVSSKIALLSSRAALQRRVNEGFVKLAPISDERLVRLDVAPKKGGSELRAVSNERGRE